MGVTEVLAHTHDIAEGLGIAYEPPAALCEAVLTRIFPQVRPAPGADHWRTLLWATGRGDLPGRAPVTTWRWSNNLVIPADRLTLQGVTPAAAADLRTGGTGGFEWIEGGPFEGTRDAAGMVTKAYEAGVHRPEFGLFVLVRREDGRAVGGMGFHGSPDEDGRAEVGYDLAESARGNGYAAEALRTLSAWALSRDDVTSLFATVDTRQRPFPERAVPRGLHPGERGGRGRRGRGRGAVRVRAAGLIAARATAAATDAGKVSGPSTPGNSTPLGSAQPRSEQQPHHLAAADLHRSGRDRVLVPVRGDVVVITLEGLGGGAQPAGEVVQFVVRDVADEVGPHAAVPRPVGRVDVDGHEESVPPPVPPPAALSAPTAETFTPALWHTQCGSAPNSGSTSRAWGSPAPQTGHNGHRPYRSRSASCTSWATSPAT